jgi:DNA helicase HerA-like ATPase
MLQWVGDRAKEFRTEYGNISAASIGAIQRAVIEVEQQGGDLFFGEPMLDVDDLLQTDRGRGVVNVLVADELIRAPKVYATFLLWMLSELFERLPEVGDADKPKLVFFFDEAHLLFNDPPASLVEKIEQVVRLIRSKGVGVYFVTQSPADVPDTVLAQLGNRVQHALRAFTPRDQKVVKAAAQTLRANPAFDTEKAITELAIGEALVSLLDAKGSPGIAERAWILTPSSRIGPLTDAERDAIRKQSAASYGHYEQTVDRESAYEKLKARTVAKEEPTASPATANAPGTPGATSGPSVTDNLTAILFGTTGPRGGRKPGLLDAAARSAAHAMGSGVGRAILRGALGSILGGSRSRR